MANIKVTSTNIDSILTDIVNDSGTSRTDNFYFVLQELNENTIRQMAWDQNLILNVTALNSFNSKFVFSDILTT